MRLRAHLDAYTALLAVVLLAGALVLVLLRVNAIR